MGATAAVTRSSSLLSPDLEAAQRIASELARHTVATPFQRRVERYITPDPTCRRYFRSLQQNPMVFRSGIDLYRRGDDFDRVFVVQAGWLIGFMRLPEGQRHIYRIYQPGDIVGVEDMNWDFHTANVETVTPAVLTAFPKSALHEIFEESPRLARTLFSMTMMDQVHCFDQLRAMGRMCADQKVASLLLQLRARCEGAKLLDDPGVLPLPLTQTHIGDTVGLTNVSVSRAMSQLADAGLIEKGSGHIRFLDREAITTACDFTDRYTNIDTSWVGTPADARRAEG